VGVVWGGGGVCGVGGGGGGGGGLPVRVLLHAVRICNCILVCSVSFCYNITYTRIVCPLIK